MLKIVLDISPKPSQGPKIGMIFAGPHKGKPTMIKPAAMRKWQSSIAMLTLKAMKEQNVTRMTGPIRIVFLEYQFAATQEITRLYRSNLLAGKQILKDTSPDVTDNLQKGLIDALKGTLFDDDGKITEMLHVRKVYGTKDQITIAIDQCPDLIVRESVDDVIAGYLNKLTEYRLQIN